MGQLQSPLLLMPNANQDMMVPSSAADSTLKPELSEDVWVLPSMAKEKLSRPPREWLCVSLTQIKPVKMISTALTSMTLWRATTANTGSPMRSLAREQSNALNLPPKTLSNSETLSSAREALARSDPTASTLTTRLLPSRIDRIVETRDGVLFYPHCTYKSTYCL